MAQPNQPNPTVATNIASARQQVNLRDYLNQRVAPFVKKAINESLDAEPQYPLQWLGEHLIHQSMLFEGNPDSTNIRERFLYQFDTPLAEPASEPNAAVPQSASSASQARTSPERLPAQAPVTNGEAVTETTIIPAQDTDMDSQVNGSIEQPRQSEENRDTDMGGIS